MTEQDKEEVGAILAAVLEQHPIGCPNGIDAKTAETLKSFAQALQTGQKTALKAIITFFVGLICTAIGYGIKELFFNR
jgi:hypothetical protein